MRQFWQRSASRLRERVGAVNVPAAALAGLGTAIAIGVMEAFSVFADYPLAVIPFATSIALVIGLPDADPAQPRALIGGHVISTIVALIVVKICGPHEWAAALAVGLAVFAMFMTDTFHPPAGIDPLLVVLGNLSAVFLLVPVLAGAVVLTAFALFWHRVVRRTPWPQRWM